jgi:small subunit ribosomal protein S1
VASVSAAPGKEGAAHEEPPGTFARSNSQRKSSWQLARDAWEADEIVEANVVGSNKGGLLVNWRGLQGFVPASQLCEVTNLHVESDRARALEACVGKTLDLKILEVEERASRLIFSERATEVRAVDRNRLLRQLERGQRRRGVVTNLADFGAFVDLGGAEGLIHISQLSWRRLTHPSDVVKPGEEVEVLVLSVDVAEGRVALSRKQLREDPWIAVEDRYHPGQLVEGTVSSLAEFGAFVLVEDELEGLIHVSELGEPPASHPAERLKCGQKVEARVLLVSESDRRLALRLHHSSD